MVMYAIKVGGYVRPETLASFQGGSWAKLAAVLAGITPMEMDLWSAAELVVLDCVEREKEKGY